jgi:hypothetical protein
MGFRVLVLVSPYQCPGALTRLILSLCLVHSLSPPLCWALWFLWMPQIATAVTEVLQVIWFLYHFAERYVDPAAGSLLPNLAGYCIEYQKSTPAPAVIQLVPARHSNEQLPVVIGENYRIVIFLPVTPNVIIDRLYNHATYFYLRPTLAYRKREGGYCELMPQSFPAGFCPGWTWLLW